MLKRENIENKGRKLLFSKINLKKNSGITLIALVVTITVLIILSTVSINAVIGDNGIIEKAKKAKQMYESSKIAEDEAMNKLYDEMEKYDDKNLIDKETSYVGYYADIDGDKEPDGIIYADLAVGGSGQWINSNGAFAYNAITGTKDYYISAKDYAGNFGTNDVLTATGSGADRFYIMGLTSFRNAAYCWYDAAYDSGISDYSTVTSKEFGTGRKNTETMIKKWNSAEYGEKNANRAYLDVWAEIQEAVNDGWFIPSEKEWAVFGKNLDITKDNFSSKRLSPLCWTSSLISTNKVVLIDFDNGQYINIIGEDINYNQRVRTFK